MTELNPQVGKVESRKGFLGFKEKTLESIFHPGPNSLSEYDIVFYEKFFQRGKTAFISQRVSKELDRIKKISASKNFSEDDALILSSKYRALDYLYGKKENIPETEVSENPLVDILILLAPSNSLSQPEEDFSYCVEGPPKQLGYLESEDEHIKQSHYSYSESKLGERKIFRTLSRFGRYQKTVIRGLYTIAEVTDRYPPILEQTLDKYVEVTLGDMGDDGRKTGVALGLLEILYNMELLTDPRFDHMCTSLRNIVLSDMETYEGLREHYYYRVVEFAPFWTEGIEKKEHESSILYNRARIDKKTKENLPLELPRIPWWNQATKEREQTLLEIEKLTPFNIILESARRTKKTLDTFTSDFRLKLRRKSELEEQVKEQNKKLPQSLRNVWKRWLIPFSKDITILPEDKGIMKGSMLLVMNFFLRDKKLSQKTATFLQNSESIYNIDPNKIADNPLFNWIFTLRDNKLTAKLETAIQKNPEEFSLLIRLMTFDLASKFLMKNELDLLFDPQYKQSANPEKLLELVRNLRTLVNKQSPNIKTIFLETLKKGDMEIEDLLEKQRVKRINKNLTDLTYRKPVPLIYVDKSRKMSRKDFLKITKIVGGAVVVGSLLHLFNQVLESSSGYEISFGNYLKLIEKTDERIPKKISKEGLEKLKPFFFGQILNLPGKYFSGTEKEPIGFFPISLTDWGVDIFDPNKNKFNNIVIVKSVTDFTLPENPYQLVISPSAVTQVTYPPVGWKIVQVIQERGSKPEVGSFGQLYYYEDLYTKEKPPNKIILVLEKTPAEDTKKYSENIFCFQNPLVVKSPGFEFDEYDLRDAEGINRNLKSDPNLQKLHREFIDEIKRTDKNDVEKLSEVAIKYTLLYNEYTIKYRFYSLDFSNDFPSRGLFHIAAYPNRGYHCSIAANAYRDFMKSGGFTVIEQSGFTLRNYSSQLWGHLAHQNNVVLLPNKKMLYTDMTPPVTLKTPKEDLEVLAQKDPSKEDLERENDNRFVLGLAGKLGIAAGIVGTALYSSYRLLGNAKQNQAVKKVEQMLQETKNFSSLEQEVLFAVTNRLAYLPYDVDFYQESARTLGLLGTFSAEKHGETIEWLLRNHPELLHTNNEDVALQRLKEGGLDLGESENYKTVFTLAKLLNDYRFEELKQKLAKSLEVNMGSEQAVNQAKYKATDILEMLKERLFEDVTRKKYLLNPENIPYFNALYQMLSSFQTE